MKSTDTAYNELGDLCERKGHTLGLKLSRHNHLTLVIERRDAKPLSTPFTLSNPDAAAKRLLEEL